jgi:aspartate/methionine/tyrosine aminotransferase
MFAPTRYLEWARNLYGQVRFDLATSGMPTVGICELGIPAAESVDDPRGWALLREAVAEHNGVPVEQSIATLGTSHALWLAYAALTSPGDDVLVEDPAYEPLVRAADGLGVRVLRFDRPANEGFAIDPDRIARALTPHTRLVCLTNLHNPSGVRADEGSLRDLARALEPHGAFLVVDEVYAAFDTFVDGRGVFSGSARNLAPNVVAVSSLTKCYGLGPHRIGWLLGPADIVRRAGDAITATCGLLPLPHAHVALRAFARIATLANRSRALLGCKRDLVDTWARAQGYEWSAPDEGLFGFATIPGAGDLTSTLESAARAREVLVAPGSFFGRPNGFRISWSAPAPVVEEGLARLALALPSPAP